MGLVWQENGCCHHPQSHIASAVTRTAPTPLHHLSQQNGCPGPVLFPHMVHFQIKTHVGVVGPGLMAAPKLQGGFHRMGSCQRWPFPLKKRQERTIFWEPTNGIMTDVVCNPLFQVVLTFHISQSYPGRFITHEQGLCSLSVTALRGCEWDIQNVK